MTDIKAVKKRRFGDRKDGRLVRTLAPMFYIEPFIMVQRCDACNYFSDQFEINEAEKYVQEKRANGMPNITLLHFTVAAYVRMISQRPAMNRFISGQRIYTRDSVEVNLCIKKEMKLNSPDSVLSIRIDRSATLDDVYRLLDDAINKTRSENTNMDKAAAIFNKIPRLIRKFMLWIIRVLDYFGLLPSFLTNLSPFHGSLFITSMASIGLPPIFHHIYNFGNVPVFWSIGRTKKTMVADASGNMIEKHYMPYAAVVDERICDGYNMASTFRTMTAIFRNPRQLDNPPEKVIEDVD